MAELESLAYTQWQQALEAAVSDKGWTDKVELHYRNNHDAEDRITQCEYLPIGPDPSTYLAGTYNHKTNQYTIEI